MKKLGGRERGREREPKIWYDIHDHSDIYVRINRKINVSNISELTRYTCVHHNSILTVFVIVPHPFPIHR